MTFKVCYWDADAKEQRERDMTPEEEAQRLFDIAAAAVPKRVPMLNAKLTLIQSGKMADIQGYLDGIPGVEGELARAYFDEALTMLRDHPLVLGIPTSIMTSAQIDALFVAAGALDA